ncbi:unnamed protein product [Trichobilharzia regenti]|nr:unnamed protein product [Trichobilharzia regenti]
MNEMSKSNAQLNHDEKSGISDVDDEEDEDMEAFVQSGMLDEVSALSY